MLRQPPTVSSRAAHVEGIPGQSSGIDGRVAWTDAAGMYPLYRAGDRIAPRVADLATDGIDLAAAATFLGVGWVTEDRTLRPGVTVVPPGATIDLDTMAVTVEPLDLDVPAPSTRELADRLIGWIEHAATEGPLRCPITAGHDSRLLVALTRAAGVDATYYTTGLERADAAAGVEIARMLGLPHEVIPHGDDEVVRRFDELADRLLECCDGMVSLWQVRDVLEAPYQGVSLHGIGGEIARGFFTGPSNLLQRDFVAQHLRRSLLTPEGIEIGRRSLEAFRERWRHRPRRDLNDLFYLDERVRRWAGANTKKDPRRFSPFVTRDWIGAAFALPQPLRYSEPLHHRLLKLLAPDLLEYRADWRIQVPYLNYLGGISRRLRGKANRESLAGWIDRLDWKTPILDDRTSELWNIVDRRQVEEASPGFSLLVVATLFRYERTGTTSPGG